jgi:acetyl esterase/lipase
MRIDRRAVLVGAGAVSMATRAAGQPAAGPEILLWPAGVPGAPEVPVRERIEPRGADRLVMNVSPPRMAVSRPARPNGSAVLLCQGGGYVRIAQSTSVAAYLNGAGVTVFDMLYRLPGDGWGAGPDAPLQDSQRALRLIRADAARFGVDPRRIGVIGFSAGGHVAGSLATRFGERVYAPVDARDQVSARPDFAVLSCPVITMAEPFVHMGSRVQLLGRTPDPAQIARQSVEAHVSAQTPPSFLVHANDDRTVPADNSILMLQALRRAGVTAEAHIFAEGGHGMGVRLPKALPASAWPELMLAWARRNGFIPA